MELILILSIAIILYIACIIGIIHIVYYAGIVKERKRKHLSYSSNQSRIFQLQDVQFEKKLFNTTITCKHAPISLNRGNMIYINDGDLHIPVLVKRVKENGNDLMMTVFGAKKYIFTRNAEITNKRNDEQVIDIEKDIQVEYPVTVKKSLMKKAWSILLLMICSIDLLIVILCSSLKTISGGMIFIGIISLLGFTFSLNIILSTVMFKLSIEKDHTVTINNLTKSIKKNIDDIGYTIHKDVQNDCWVINFYENNKSFANITSKEKYFLEVYKVFNEAKKAQRHKEYLTSLFTREYFISCDPESEEFTYLTRTHEEKKYVVIYDDITTMADDLHTNSIKYEKMTLVEMADIIPVFRELDGAMFVYKSETDLMMRLITSEDFDEYADIATNQQNLN